MRRGGSRMSTLSLERPAVVPPYVTSIAPIELFVDHTYQRELDVNRCKHMAATWDPRLVGVLEVSDRGEGWSPRYAIVNGQHRWWAAGFIEGELHLVCNVHTGLSVADEAKLFNELDAKTKKISNWDRWYARRASGDFVVMAIDSMCAAEGWIVSHNPGPSHLQCCSALEWVYDRCIPETITYTLQLIGDVWPEDPEGIKAPVIKGISLVLHDYAEEIDTGRLADVLTSLTPKQLAARGHELKARGYDGALAKLIQTAVILAYNKSTKSGLRLP